MASGVSDLLAGEVRYIGDGVYASFDGYQIWLRVGSHTAPPLVAIEPEVLESLCELATEINKDGGAYHFRGVVHGPAKKG